MCRRYMKIFFINTRIELNTLKSVHFFIKHVEYKLIYSLRLRHASCMDGGGTKRKKTKKEKEERNCKKKINKKPSKNSPINRLGSQRRSVRKELYALLLRQSSL